MVKPFGARELLARIRAVLRRTSPDSRKVAQFGDVTVDFEHREVQRSGTPVSLAAKELQLLRQLIDHRGQVLSRERLLSRVWHDQPFIGPRTVDVHIAWLRQKLEENPQSPRHILTVRGEGYCFEP